MARSGNLLLHAATSLAITSGLPGACQGYRNGA
jgi:hypothetical protein